MSISVGLRLRIQEALEQKNLLKQSRWDDEPPQPKSKDMWVYEVCSASRPLLHLYQLYLDLQSERDHIDDLDKSMRLPYQEAINSVSALMKFDLCQLLVNGNDSWVITSHGKIFEYEYQPIEKEDRSRHKGRSYLHLVKS